jgi:hypothetical protein
MKARGVYRNFTFHTSYFTLHTFCQWLLIACWIGLQGATGLSNELKVGRLKVEGSENNFQPANLQPVNLQPATQIQPPTLLAKSSKCPADVETLTSLLLRDLPSYATRVLRRSRRPTGTSGNLTYVVLAGRPEFEPLTLGPGQYTSPALAADLEPPKQVFLTTLERQYRGNKASYLQLYHWLFLAKTTDGWRLAMMFSRIGSSSGRILTPPEESSNGVVGQAVSIWLRDCRAGAIRGAREEAEGSRE